MGYNLTPLSIKVIPSHISAPISHMGYNWVIMGYNLTPLPIKVIPYQAYGL